MSLNKSLDRLFNEIRREARRNPEFADRLDAVLRTHDSRRDVDEAAIAAVGASEEAPAPEAAPAPVPAKKPKQAAAPALNPVAILQRGGEDALEEALISHNREALLALVAEHNLDPGGEAGAFSREDLQAHVVAQAKKRVERDRKLFDY